MGLRGRRLEIRTIHICKPFSIVRCGAACAFNMCHRAACTGLKVRGLFRHRSKYRRDFDD